ncbi:MAG: hypothetical protein ACXVF9_21555 [Blastococcus sp.]
MDPVTLLHWDRHVLTCACCRAAVAEERRVLAALRAPAQPTVPGDLRGMLLALAADPSATGLPSGAPGSPDRSGAEGAVRASDAAAGHGRDGFPTSIPVAPVRVVDRGTPAMHRSARRATVFAGLAAGATAAAAWGVAMTGATAPVPGSAATPGLVHGMPSATSPFAPAAFMVANLGRARTTSVPSASGSASPSAARAATARRSTSVGATVRPAVSGLPVRSAESTP